MSALRAFVKPPRSSDGTWAAAGQALTLRTPDGQLLSATAYLAAPGAPALVVASATGVPQSLYRHFALWLQQQGVSCYTFDYRGIAASRPAQLRKFTADFSHWAIDIDTVLQQALAAHPRVSLLGHSIGGFLAPVAAQAPAMHRLVMVGAQSAYWRDWPLKQRLPMLVMWHGLMPLITQTVGYFPGRAMRLGEDLPKGVAMQWALRPWNDPLHRDTHAGQQYARALPPVHMVAASDDPFATTAAQQRVQDALLEPGVTRHVWQPQAFGLRTIGHFNAFRRPAAALWPHLLDMSGLTT
jgi:predicted alpha/beta hydrolase